LIPPSARDFPPWAVNFRGGGTWGGREAGPGSSRARYDLRVPTFSPKPSDVQRAWHVVDADGLVLGRMASEVARLLRGKHKPIFAPHLDTGDHVIVVNAAKVVLTSGKEAKKIAYWHSGYPGGLKQQTYADMMVNDPEEVVRRAVRGMLPKNPLGRAMFSKLKVYAGDEHPHAAQLPQPRSMADAARRQPGT